MLPGQQLCQEITGVKFLTFIIKVNYFYSCFCHTSNGCAIIDFRRLVKYFYTSFIQLQFSNFYLKIIFSIFFLSITGKVCPSPLLGVCPPCENCKDATTTTPPPPSNTPITPSNNNTLNTIGNTYNTTSVVGGGGGGLPGKETDPGPFDSYQGPENKGSSAPPAPKLNEENKGSENLFPSNLPKNWQPKHLKTKQI